MSAPTPVRRGRPRDASPLISRDRRGTGDGSTAELSDTEHPTGDEVGAAPGGGADLPLAEFDDTSDDEVVDQPAAPREPNVFDRLDDRIVPRLQSGAARVASVLAVPFAALTRLEDRIAGGRLVDALFSRRLVLVLATALLFFAGTYAHLVRYDPATEPAEAPVAGGVETEALSGATVGPAIGEALDAYEEDRLSALASASEDERRAAVVSFDELLTGEQAGSFLDGLPADAAQLRLPGEGQEPLEVPVEGDIAAAVDEAVEAHLEQVAAEEDEFRRLLESETITDAEYEEFYTEELDGLAAVREELEGGAAVVFAVVVNAEVRVLTDLQEQERVRLVDIAPASADPEESVFYGLLPSDADSASWGSFR